MALLRNVFFVTVGREVDNNTCLSSIGFGFGYVSVAFLDFVSRFFYVTFLRFTTTDT